MQTAKICTRDHSLRPHVRFDDVFDCNYCLEKGMGPRFQCVRCHTIKAYHPDCVSLERSRTHRFFPGVTFTLSNPKGNRACAACGRLVRGVGYYGIATNLCLHPCCAYLPPKIEGKEGYVYLDDKMLSDCEICERKDPGWCYRTKMKDHYSHIFCTKEAHVRSLQNQIFANPRDRLDQVVRRSQIWKTEWEHPSGGVRLIKDNSFPVKVYVNTGSSDKTKRVRITKLKKSRGFWRRVSYSIIYLVASAVGFPFAPVPLLLQG